MDDEKTEYDEKTHDVDEIAGTDIKINPDYYIHKVLLKAQDAMIKDNVEDGFVQYRQCIEYLEVLARAADRLPKNYGTDIDEFMKSKEYTASPSNLSKSVILANKKLGLIMKDVFSNKVTTSPLKA